MILIVEMEVFAKFQEAQMNEVLSLTGKDVIYLVTKEGGVLPVSMLPALTKINAKVEIITLSKQDSGFEKGFIYGSIAGNAIKDKVVILSDEPSPATLGGNIVWNEGFGVKPKKRSPKVQKEKAEKVTGAEPSKAVVPEVAEIPMAKDAVPVKRTRKPKAMDNGNADGVESKPVGDFYSTLALTGCQDLISGKEDLFKKCLLDASDAEIGYKMLLGLNFGTNGDRIWAATRGMFKKLRKLA